MSATVQARPSFPPPSLGELHVAGNGFVTVPAPRDPIVAAREALEAAQQAQRLVHDSEHLVEWALGFDADILEGVLADLLKKRSVRLSEPVLLRLLEHPRQGVREKAIILLGRIPPRDEQPSR